ncbi:MAG TPA: TadE/TadG family type IV pilus assembly protein [Vineibacter sp.]|nr:TadE/TadG family type IV pilus assembly protein [Vineibacter sp.]
MSNIAKSAAGTAESSKGLWSALRRDSRGGTALLVGFSMPVIIGALGFGVDTGVWYLEKRKLQQIADTASLAAVRTMTGGGSSTQAQAVALSDAVRNGYVAGATSTFTVNTPPTSGAYAGNPSAVEVVTTRKLPLFFSGYFLASAGNISARSVAYQSMTLGKNVEVSLMLDVSSSMNGATEVLGVSKLQGMKNAAKGLIDIVVQSSQAPQTSRVALVPYSSAVNVGSTYFTAATNKTLSGSWSSVVERSGSSAFTDDAPAAGKWLGDLKTKKANAHGPYSTFVQTLMSNVPSSAKLVPLSSDKTSLNASVDAFTASGTTAGHIGAAWTWYAMSPKWSGVFSGGSTPNAYDATQTHKVAVLLSDFDMNSYFETSNGNATTQTQALCNNMKAAGITVYTVAYGLNASDSTAVNLWKNCATSVDTRFSTSTVEGMNAAFQAIAAAAVSVGATVSPMLVE